MSNNFIDDLRAAHNASGNATKPFDEQEAIQELIKSWLQGDRLPFISIILTVVAWIVHYCLTRALRYTFWQVIGTLAIVEAPEATFRHESETYTDKDDAPKVRFTEHRTYTSSIRTTIRHLYRVGGPLSFFRGFAICIPYYILYGGVVLAIQSFLSITELMPQYVAAKLGEELSQIILALALAQFDTAFTHIVITKPTFRFWLQRLPSLRATIIRVWPAVVVYGVASALTFAVPNLLRTASGLDHRFPAHANATNIPAASSTAAAVLELTGRAAQATAADMSELVQGMYAEPSALKAATATGLPAAGQDALNATPSFTDLPTPPWSAQQRVAAVTIWLVAQVLRVFVLVPAGVALTRVQAALLPEDEETIVPMDRSFGTMAVSPGILSTPVTLGLRQAWRSYGRSDKVRILTLYAKFVAVEALMCALFATFLGKEIWPANKTWNPQL